MRAGHFVTLFAVMSLTQVALAGQTPPARSDLQGVWISRSATPLERPKALEGRATLTDEEVADLKRKANRIFHETNSDFPAGDAVFLAALADVDRYTSPNSTAGGDDSIEREFDNRTSLIVDPPDGRVPPLTPEAAKRASAFAASRVRHDPTDPEDVSFDRRCISFGTPRLGGNYGAGPYSYYEIVQTPDYLVVTTEFIHEARIIPLDGRPHLSAAITRWNGDSRGHWEGRTLVVDTTNFSQKSHFMGSAEHLHLVERFTRTDADTIAYYRTFDPAPRARSMAGIVSLAGSATPTRILPSLTSGS